MKLGCVHGATSRPWRVAIDQDFTLASRTRRGARTLLAFRQNDKAFFIYGFEKNECANVSDRELKALKLLAKELLKYPGMTLTKAIDAGELIEIEVNDDGKKPNGPSLKLLNLVEQKGLEALG